MSAVAADAELPQALQAGIAALGIAVPADAGERLVAYLSLLDKWNRTYNLSAIREPAKMLTHHLLDSLAILPELDERTGGRPTRVLDVGSGAGLPGVPIALARTAWHVDMLEPVHKKASFITQAIAELRIANARAIAARVEDHHDEKRYDVVVSRAFSDLASFASASARHLRDDAVLVAMKGVHPDEELEEMDDRFAVEVVRPLHVPGLDAARHLVVMRRLRA